MFSKHAHSSVKRFAPKAHVQTESTLKFEGSFQLAKHAPRATLLQTLSSHHAASDGALDVLQWAAASLRGMEGCDEAKAKGCKDVLLRAIACSFSEQSAALDLLPSPLLGRLLRCDETNTQTEEPTLLALAPWLEAPARTAEEVAEALQGLRWALGVAPRTAHLAAAGRGGRTRQVRRCRAGQGPGGEGAIFEGHVQARTRRRLRAQLPDYARPV